MSKFYKVDLSVSPGKGTDHDRVRFNDLIEQYKDVLAEITNRRYETAHFVVAGGFLRGIFSDKEQVNDIDIFVVDPIRDGADERLDTLCYHFEWHVRAALDSANTWNVVFRCPENKLVTFMTPEGTKVQLIREKSYETTEHLLNTFDIRACCFALVLNEHTVYDLYAIQGAEEDVKSKDIVINNVEYPLATINRIARYKTKGYRIREHEMQRFMLMTYRTMKQYEQESLANVVPDSFLTRSDVDVDLDDLWQPFFDDKGRLYID